MRRVTPSANPSYALRSSIGYCQCASWLSTIKLPNNPIQLVQISILDMQRAALAAVIDAHVKPERVGQAPLQRLGVGCLRPRFAARLARLRRAILAHRRLDLAHVQAALDDVLRDL